MGCKYFCKSTYSLESLDEWCGNYVTLHHENVGFFSLLKRPSENSESLENLSQGDISYNLSNTLH